MPDLCACPHDHDCESVASLGPDQTYYHMVTHFCFEILCSLQNLQPEKWNKVLWPCHQHQHQHHHHHHHQHHCHCDYHCRCRYRCQGTVLRMTFSRSA